MSIVVWCGNLAVAMTLCKQALTILKSNACLPIYLPFCLPAGAEVVVLTMINQSIYTWARYSVRFFIMI